QVEQQVPQREAVLAARHRDEDALAGLDHPVAADGLRRLLATMRDEVLGAEVGVVPGQVDHGRAPADATLHHAPPESTGRTSTVSVSARSSSPGTSVPSRMTSTDSRLSSRRVTRVWTRIGPAISISRRGLRSSTFTGAIVSPAPHEPLSLLGVAHGDEANRDV